MLVIRQKFKYGKIKLSLRLTSRFHAKGGNIFIVWTSCQKAG